MSLNIKLIGPPETVMSNPGGAHAYFGWPTVTRLQNGTIAVGASGYRVEHVCPFGKAVLSFSYDGGKTYTEPKAVIDTVLDDRDAGLTVFGDKGLILTSFNNSVEFQRHNMPQTQECFDYINSVSPQDEAEALGVTFRISNDLGETFGKIYKSPVTSPHGPVELSDGTVLWVGNVFGENKIEAYTVDTESGKMTYRGKIDSEGLDYREFCEPHIIELPDGKILCHIRIEDYDGKLFTLFQSVSNDKGRTWSKPEQIIGDRSGAPAHLFLHSSGVLITTFSHRDLPYGIHMVASTDGGNTWSEEFTLFETFGSGDLGYPSTVELDDGSLLTVFYTKEKEGKPAVIMQQKWCFENTKQ